MSSAPKPASKSKCVDCKKMYLAEDIHICENHNCRHCKNKKKICFKCICKCEDCYNYICDKCHECPECDAQVCGLCLRTCDVCHTQRCNNCVDDSFICRPCYEICKANYQKEIDKIDTNIIIVPSTKYYALWLYMKEDDPDILNIIASSTPETRAYQSQSYLKYANAISENPNSLIELHIKELDACNMEYYNYRDRVEKVTVEPIYCYTYNTETKTFQKFCNSDIKDGNNFYATQGLPNIRKFNAFLEGNNYIPDNTIRAADNYSIAAGDNIDTFTEMLVYLPEDIHAKIRNNKYNTREHHIMPIMLSEFNVVPNVYYSECIANT